MSFMSPLDLLTVPSQEQDIIRCLVRRPGLTLLEIARSTRIPVDEVERLVDKMVADLRLKKEQDDTFQVEIRNGRSKPERGTGLMESLFS